ISTGRRNTLSLEEKMECCIWYIEPEKKRDFLLRRIFDEYFAKEFKYPTDDLINHNDIFNVN
ncbi:MAG: hypothetical protein KAS48_07485, partial [Gammaproteobacteria bacterium]|nr:hypothetical protein [Gammaproteobacteria bacterium]